jgi:hypothetical protein
MSAHEWMATAWTTITREDSAGDTWEVTVKSTGLVRWLGPGNGWDAEILHVIDDMFGAFVRLPSDLKPDERHEVVTDLCSDVWERLGKSAPDWAERYGGTNASP